MGEEQPPPSLEVALRQDGSLKAAACTFVCFVPRKTVRALPRESLVMCGVAVTERVHVHDVHK